MTKGILPHCVVHPDYRDQFEESWFDPVFWQQNQAVLQQAQGRGNTMIVQNQDGHYALRAYLRGGMVARFNRDKYWFSGAERTRSFQEFALTKYLYDQGLPVPKPVAARYVQKGLWYRADLLTEYIANSQTLLSFLQANAGDTAILQRVKTVVQKFHAIGLNHVDLNVRNILITDAHAIYLIDFDRCHLKGTAQTATDNFMRLARSIKKDLGLEAMF